MKRTSKEGKIKVYKGSLRGFTLMELVITLSIISLLLASSVFIFQNAKYNTQLETTARILHSDMLLGQQLAIDENQKYYFKFYPKFYEFYPQDKSQENKRSLPTAIKIMKTTFNKKNPGKDCMFFYPSGTPSSGGTIHLIAENGKKSYVIVSYYHGRIRISDKPP